MSDELKLNLIELENRKKELQSKLDEINAKREEEIQALKKKYDHMNYDITYNIEKLEREFYNDLVKSFLKIVSKEFEEKRSKETYELTNNFRTYREIIVEFEMFPKELIKKLDVVINGGLIEDIIYEIEDIEKKYIKNPKSYL